jgi:hypothetical protein
MPAANRIIRIVATAARGLCLTSRGHLAILLDKTQQTRTRAPKIPMRVVESGMKKQQAMMLYIPAVSSFDCI